MAKAGTIPHTIDVLAPGPSLKDYDKTRKPELTVCINRAIKDHPCEWWAVQDTSCWREIKERPSRGLITSSVFQKKMGLSKYLVLLLKDSTNRRVNWTSPRALDTIVEAWKGWDIHLWGFDMVGIKYYDDTQWLPGANPNSRRTIRQLEKRSVGRWAQEAEMIAHILAMPNVHHHKVG